jgi:predicted ATP-grasp superfamily ATP-dependent carboligase
MRIFVYEHVTGGGLDGEALPPGLAREADLMVRTLIGELASCPEVECLTSRDPRLPPVAGAESIGWHAGETARERFRRGTALAGAVWPTAPESGGVLADLATEVEAQGRLLLGCRPAAVRIASSKRATTDLLQRAGIPAVPTFARAEEVPPFPGRWVTKPDDGAGAEATHIVTDWREARNRLAAATLPLVAQPWLEGDPMSLSLLCDAGRSRLLSCNRQRIAETSRAVSLAGIEVNVAVEHEARLTTLARRIATALPGLWGYVGVDFIWTSAGPVVLEVNPRLTTSYCGLGRARGINVAAMVLALVATPGTLGMTPSVPGETVTLTLESAHAG